MISIVCRSRRLSFVCGWSASPLSLRRHHRVQNGVGGATSVRRISNTLVSLSSTSSLDSSDPVVVPKKFVPYPFQYREEQTLRVVSLTNLGMGVCRVSVPTAEESGEKEEEVTDDNSSSWVVFVPSVLPGELVRVRIFRNHKTYSDADLLEIVEPSPDRVDSPLCPLSTICGGCQYQHMTIEAQRDWKTQHVKEVLERIGDFENINVSPAVGTDQVWHYRSKLTPHYDAPKKIAENQYEISRIGFKQKTSRRLVDVEYCPIATEAINDKLTELRSELHLKAQTGQLRRPKKGATLLLRDADQGVVTDHNTYVTTSVSGLNFRFLAGNFFQNNPSMLPVLVDHVVQAATRIPPNSDKPMSHLIDCYCGSGLFCLSCASSFDHCVGIEINDKAVEEASANAQLNKIDNCAFVAATAEAIFEARQSDGGYNVEDFPRDQTVVVVDPPRKGCSEEFLEQLYQFGAQRIVYMSCDPATQARDAKGIVESGYEITSVQPFDLFPQTRHIESLVVFERKS